jgi:hypothetical protein
MMYDSFIDELEKIAATRALKIVRRAFNEHGKDEADHLARSLVRRGALKRTAAGSQIKRLGGGAEGQAVVSVGQRQAGGGIAARKSIDPDSMFGSDAMIDRKVEMARRNPRDPNWARHLGEERLGGGRHHFNEYVEGRSGNQVLEENSDLLERAYKKEGISGFLAKVKAHRSVDRDAAALNKIETKSSKKYLASDVTTNPGNWIKARDGTIKAIDSLPITRKELQGMLDNQPDAITEDGIKSMWSKAGVPINKDGFWGATKAKGTLSRLGPGSRQSKKVRGGKPLPSVHLRPSRQEVKTRIAYLRAKRGNS